MSSTFQYDWLTSSWSWDSQRECSSKSRRYSWFDCNRDCRISCVVIGIHSLQGCRSVHMGVTIITIGVWMPRGKRSGQRLGESAGRCQTSPSLNSYRQFAAYHLTFEGTRKDMVP